MEGHPARSYAKTTGPSPVPHVGSRDTMAMVTRQLVGLLMIRFLLKSCLGKTIYKSLMCHQSRSNYHCMLISSFEHVHIRMFKCACHVATTTTTTTTRPRWNHIHTTSTQNHSNKSLTAGCTFSAPVSTATLDNVGAHGSPILAGVSGFFSAWEWGSTRNLGIFYPNWRMVF